MSHYIYLHNRKFHIAKHNIPAAHRAVIDAFKLRYKYRTPEDFVDMLDQYFDWYVGVNEFGDVHTISYDGEKFGDSDVLFATLAPYVTKGSFLEVENSEGGHWRWVFDGKKLISQEARIVYDPFPWEQEDANVGS